MILKKPWLLLCTGLTIVTPIAIIASCSTSDSSQNNYQMTRVKSVINYRDLKLSNNINEAIGLINKEFIISNKSKIFNGTNELLINQNQIDNFNAELANQEILVEFDLLAGAYIDQSNQISSTSKSFKFKINGFNKIQPDDDLLNIIENATFNVDNKSRLASSVKVNEIKWEQKDLHSNINFNVSQIFPDDSSGKLGFEAFFNNEKIVVEPEESKAISGFQIKAPTESDQKLVQQEIALLTTNNPIKIASLKTSELLKYQQNPNDFINQLSGLKENEFNYRIKQFSYQASDNQNVIISIILLVSKNNASAQVSLSQTIAVVDDKPQIPTNDELMRQIELNRLKRMIPNLTLKQTTFDEEKINELRQDPNKIIGFLNGFVMQQYFYYKISDFNVKTTTKTTATIEFTISAKLWKAINPNIIFKTDTLKFPITIKPAVVDYQPDTTNYQWKINPSSNVTTVDDENQISFDLKNDHSLDLAKIDWNNGDQFDQLIKAIFKAKQDYFVTIDGKIDPKWTWNDNLMFITYGPEENVSLDQVKSFTATVVIFNTNSQDLDDQLQLNVKFINGYNSGKLPVVPSVDEQWNKIENDFQNLIKTQAFSEEKIHSGDIGDVYSFAQITTDSETKSSYFSNFLNFSPSDFAKNHGFNVSVKTKDVKINYLTNEVKFKWVLEGNKDLSGKKWESPNEQKITYNVKEATKVQTTGVLAINDANVTLINNILDPFTISNKPRTINLQKDILNNVSKNWTWKAREFANYVRFTFYQAFNDGASAINMGIINLPSNDFGANPQNYTIVLKAKLNQEAAGQYLPFLQMFGAAANISAKQWNVNDIIEIRLNVNSVAEVADVVTSASEILPGLSAGNTWAKAKGYEQIYLMNPPRTDLFNIFLGTTSLTINHNGSTYLNSTKATHRFLSLNLMARYDFKDPIWAEPPLNGWVKE